MKPHIRSLSLALCAVGVVAPSIAHDQSHPFILSISPVIDAACEYVERANDHASAFTDKTNKATLAEFLTIFDYEEEILKAIGCDLDICIAEHDTESNGSDESKIIHETCARSRKILADLHWALEELRLCLKGGWNANPRPGALSFAMKLRDVKKRVQPKLKGILVSLEEVKHLLKRLDGGNQFVEKVERMRRIVKLGLDSKEPRWGDALDALRYRLGHKK